jgi:hypothetical protein
MGRGTTRGTRTRVRVLGAPGGVPSIPATCYETRYMRSPDHPSGLGTESVPDYSSFPRKRLVIPAGESATSEFSSSSSPGRNASGFGT